MTNSSSSALAAAAQDLFALGANPTIAVMGIQSRRLVEAFVGREVLPRGSDICRRRPLELQLVHQLRRPEDAEADEWGEFLHFSGRHFYDFREIQREIQAEMDREVGESDWPVHLKIFSPNVLNMTLLLLPGITKAPVGDQPADTEARIRALTMSYIRQKKYTLLHVSPKDADFESSDTFQMAQVADPDGSRTIGVITKDIMDMGTDAHSFSLGDVILGVINWSQQESVMGQQLLTYALVARGTVILAEYTEFLGNFIPTASQLLLDLPASGQNFTFNRDGHTFNYLVEDGLTYCVAGTTDRSLGRELPFAFLDRVKKDFTKRNGSGTTNSRDFRSKLKEHMQYCVDHPEEVSKLAKLNSEPSEVKVVMMENIEKVLDHGKKIELLEKTENLRSQVAMTVEQEAAFKIALLKMEKKRANWPSNVTSLLLNLCAQKIENHLMPPGLVKEDPVFGEIAKELFMRMEVAYTPEKCYTKLKNLKEQFWTRIRELRKQNLDTNLESEDLLKEMIFGLPSHNSKEPEGIGIYNKDDKDRDDSSFFELEKENKSLKEQVKIECEARKGALRLYNEEKKKVAYLQDELKKAEKLRSVMHNELMELKGNLRVFCRVRPTLEANATYPEEGEFVGRRVDIKGPANIVSFTCDKVFEEGASQKVIFEEICELVQSALDGRKVTIFAYGQTGSGKSHTMTGGHGNEEKGIIPRALDKIFETIKSRNSHGAIYSVKISVLEVYINEIKDLLSGKLCSIIHQNGDAIIRGLESCSVQTATEAGAVFEKAVNKRSVKETLLNAHSSRSHLILKLLISQPQNGQEMNKFEGVLSLIDLAGSEKHQKSGATTGDLFEESKAINTSLLCLNRVFEAIKTKKAHIPFRDGKLTEVFETCLGKDSKVLMFVNVTPEKASFEETSATFEFASSISSCSTEVKLIQHNTIGFKSNKKATAMKKQREIGLETPGHSKVRQGKRVLLSPNCLSMAGRVEFKRRKNA